MEEGESSDLIDVSSENDSLILDFSAPLSSSAAVSALFHHPFSEVPDKTTSSAVSVTLNYNKIVDTAKTNGEIEQLPELSLTTEPEITKRTGKCNLRKSLAWDSAFFTSAGVLDADELSSIIEGAENGQKCILPSIEEDIRRSGDSISTLESDSLTLESLEAELFEDIRASIQRSNIASKVENSTSSSTSKGTDAQFISSLKKSDLAQNGMKPSPLLKNQTLGVQGSEKTIKQGPGYLQVHQSAVKIGDSSSFLSKPPKATSRINPISAATTKRTSLGASRVKTGNTKGTQAPNLSGLVGARRVAKPASSSKLLSLCSSTGAKKEPTKISSLHNSFGHTSSANVGKSSLNPVRRKIDSRSSDIPSTGSMLKTPSKVVLNNKTLSRNSRLAAHLMSSKLSSSISPASSISEWSAESSSSSTSTINQRSNRSRASLETSSCRSLDSDISTLDLKACSNVSCSDQHGNEVPDIANQNKKEASTQTRPISRPGSMKPSGLRMPSPKIGFFDGVKSTVRTPNVGAQSPSGLPAGMYKMGVGVCSPSRSSSKAKVGKLPRTVSGAANTNSQKSVSPKPLQASSASKTAKTCSNTAPEIQGKIMERASCLKPDLEIQRPAHDLETGLYDEKTGIIGVSADEASFHMIGSANSNDSKVALSGEDLSDSGVTIFENLNQFVDEISLGHQKKDPCPHLKNIEMEKGPSGDLVDGLSKLETKDAAGGAISDTDASKFLNELTGKVQEDYFSGGGDPLDYPSLPVPPINIQTTASTRTLVLENVHCSVEGIDVSKVSGHEAVDSSTLPSFENGEKENT